ncbi:hypothetical protein CRUP_027624 [Coryphaenoides rupestris]|nr:hypothetical protein CRUP_027624 [Coryphaenoides rupestris]
MHWLFPGSVDMGQVKVQAMHKEDFKHNYNLLEVAFAKNGIIKSIPVEQLISGSFKANFALLKWFRKLFTENTKDLVYDPVEARAGKEIRPTPLLMNSPRKASWRLEFDPMEESKRKTFPYTEEWNDVYSWVEPSDRGEMYARCSVCHSDLSTYRKGLTDLHRHFATNKHRKRALSATRLRGRTAVPKLPCSDATVHFITKYCSPGGGTSPGDLASGDFPCYMLGLQYPQDISSVCQQTPYCLYVYGGVPLEEAAVVSVVIVGFFDVESATHRVRLLDVLPSPAGGEMEGEQAKQEGEAVVETLKRFDLPLTNLSAVYTHGNGGASSAQICSQLRELSPNLVASSLLNTYASNFLNPQAVARFLEERNPCILTNTKFHLSEANLLVGGSAAEDLLSDSPSAEALPTEQIMSFYVTLTGHIAKVLPLSDGMLRNIAQLLNPQSRLHVTETGVEELGRKLGVCSSPEEAKQLTKEFLEYQQAGEEQSNTGEDDSAAISLERHWAGVLRDGGSNSVLRKLVLSLLSFPCPPLEAQRVYAQGPTRGGYGCETSLRQKPPSRAVFQAGRGTWVKPVGLSKDVGRESDEELGKDSSPSSKLTPSGRILRRIPVYEDGKGFPAGVLVWGKLKGFSMWPALITPWKNKSPPPGMRRVEWFGDGMFSEIHTEGLLPFRAFTKCFCKNSYASLPIERCNKSFAAANGIKELELKLMLDWAFGGFLPTGPSSFAPASDSKTDQSDSPGYNPPTKRKYVRKAKANLLVVTYNRDLMLQNIEDKQKKIEGMLELLKRFFDILCFCKECIDTLVGKGTFDQLKDVDPWSCYMCKPSECSGNLRLRSDWSLKVQEFFVNNSALEFEPHRVYPSISAEQRRPIRVLSLFDGIATGYLVLKELGIKVDHYVASEICGDSIAVGMIKHEGKIEYVHDVRTITRKHGTGRLFFEFYRLLTMMRPKMEDNRPFFWLFENVVFMSACDKSDICRFLECNPILIDAVKVSPAHRARYFWGNVPGMNRPLATSLDDKVGLQDCLEIGRKAKFEKVRTITTKSNSIRQGKSVFGFPKHYTDVNNMGRTQRQRVLGRSWSVPVIRHLFAPLKDYFECESGQTTVPLQKV